MQLSVLTVCLSQYVRETKLSLKLVATYSKYLDMTDEVIEISVSFFKKIWVRQ